MWRDAGAEVERYRVRIPRALLMELVAKNPSRFTVHARNPERNTEIGGNKVAFAPTYGSPFVYDFDNQRRYGTLADLNQFHKLAYMAPAMHNTGAVICEPVDIAIPKRHLHITYSAIKHSDKPFMGPVTAPERAADALQMAQHPVRRGVRRPAHGDHGAGQLQLAPGLGRDHAGRAQGLRARQPVGDHLAVRAGGRQHAGVRRRLGRAAQRRGARPGSRSPSSAGRAAR